MARTLAGGGRGAEIRTRNPLGRGRGEGRETERKELQVSGEHAACAQDEEGEKEEIPGSDPVQVEFFTPRLKKKNIRTKSVRR